MAEPRLLDTPAGKMSVRQTALHYGLNRNTLIRRLWAGYTVEQAVKPATRTNQRRPDTRDRIYTPNNVWTPWGFISVKDACARNGLDRFVASDRKTCGWPMYLAVAVPLHISRESWSGLEALEAGIRKAKEKFYGDEADRCAPTINEATLRL